MTISIKQNEVAVDQGYWWLPMSSCPRAVKVQLLNPSGVAVYGAFMGEKYWLGWAPLPKVRK